MPIHNLVFFGCFFNFMLRLMDGWGNWQRRHNVWGQEEYDLLGSMRYLHVPGLVPKASNLIPQVSTLAPDKRGDQIRTCGRHEIMHGKKCEHVGV
ncbi:Os01g0627150 [Oryza sativa Japonica Group]|uniref:Os01g0627150 protein n=1 Tax=Oryza sativa subsp. japonica TaxID=39947 RepID=A0A0P0V5H5_ORYSJ|nr:Os01g0627150 [Oryza sativa Japonica Group]